MSQNSHDSEPRPPSTLVRWLAFVLCIIAVWVVMFVIAPMGQRLAAARPLMDYIEETGINASALYYTGVPETAEAEMYLRNASEYAPMIEE